ncbi:MAG: protein kinase [Planctomycetes bacterium]|nr:protein kinase [Planctomycetota bacterium]
MEVSCNSCGAVNLLSPDHTSLTLCCKACGNPIDLTEIANTLTMESGLSLADHLKATVISSGVGSNPEELPASLEDRVAPYVNPDADNMLGNYRLEKELERTPLGRLYRGEQIALRRPVFVFILDEELAAEEECAQTFLNEVRRSAALMHPHIARVYQVGSEGNSCYVVSEFIKDDSLEANLQTGKRFDLLTIIQSGIEIARGLAVAHSMQLLHWGLSPKNVYLTPQGEVRITQFGISHALFASKNSKEKLIRAGYFLPPEESLAEFSPQVDFFGLGVILYAMLTGAMPGQAPAASNSATEATIIPLQGLEETTLKIPRSMSRLLQKIFSWEPHERPASASDLAQELERIRLEITSPPMPAVKPPRTPAKVNKRRYKRFRTDMPMKISRADISREQQDEYIAKLENLSENGAYILTASPLPPGSFVNLNFEMKPGAGSRVEALGIVRWNDNTPGNIGMGVQFLEVSTNNRRNLNDYVDRQTAYDMVNTLANSALHKAILRILAQNWDNTIKLENLMRSTGASKRLFDRTLSDFEKNGLVKPMGNKLLCIRPVSESVEKAIEELLRTSH